MELIEKLVERARENVTRIDARRMQPGETTESYAGTLYVKGTRGEIRRVDAKLSKKERKQMKAELRRARQARNR